MKIIVIILNEGITMCLQFNKRYTVYGSKIFLIILKQCYMFRLKASHLQALTTFSVTRYFAHQVGKASDNENVVRA